MRFISCGLLLLVAVLPLESRASEARLIEAHDGAVVRVSVNEPNLIEADQGRITAFVFAEGKFVQTVDAESGVIYFRPLEEGPRSGFVEVASDSGARRRFGLLIVPDPDWPAQRIVLKDRVPSPAPLAQEAHVPVAADHVASIKSMMRSILTGDGIVLDQSGLSIKVGAFLLERKATRKDGGLVGEIYLISNTSNEPRVVDEASLHLSEEVIAVALVSRQLQAGSAGEAYLVKATPGSPR